MHFARRYGYKGVVATTTALSTDAIVNATSGSLASDSIRLGAWEQLLHDSPYLRDFGVIWLSALSVGFSVYVGLSTYLHVSTFRRSHQAKHGGDVQVAGNIVSLGRRCFFLLTNSRIGFFMRELESFFFKKTTKKLSNFLLEIRNFQILFLLCKH